MHFGFTCPCGTEYEDFTRGSPVKNGEIPLSFGIDCEGCDRRFVLSLAEVRE